MLSGINYELAKSIHSDRLKEAEQARLVRIAKSAPTTKPNKKWSLSFHPGQRLISRPAIAKSH